MSRSLTTPVHFFLLLTALVGAGMMWLSTWTGAGPPATGSLLWNLGRGLPTAIVWLGGAMGLGWPLRLWLTRSVKSGLAIQLGVGVGAMTMVDAGLGASGLLFLGDGLVAWGLSGLGLGLLVVQGLRSRRCDTGCSIFDPFDPVLLAAVPALAVLMAAACSTPGWLWASEFGGFDALSYHLQLPREWAQAGRIVPLEHNIYSFLPGYGEAAFSHLRTQMGPAHGFAFGAQMLHGLLTAATSLITIRLATSAGLSRLSGSVAGVLLLGTPWVIVVGSLAYNEMLVTMLLATGLLLLIEEDQCSWRRGLAIGLLAGWGCGAKLTGIGFVAVPLGVALLWCTEPRKWAAAVLLMAAGGAIALAPYFVRNTLHSGNPVFPFATEIFRPAHWSPTQVEIWNSAHRFQGSVLDRLIAAWNQLIRFGIGSEPANWTDTWQPQWSMLFVLCLVGLGFGLASRSTRRIATLMGLLLLTQLMFWLLGTHLKSRFMLPAVIPAVILVVTGLEVVLSRLIGPRQSPADRHSRAGGDPQSWRPAPWLVGLAGLLYAFQPVLLYKTERGGSPALGLAQPLPSFDLGKDRTLLIGEAAVFRYAGNFDYTTTWDRGPLSTAMQQSDDPASWINVLKDLGYRYVLVDFGMLDNWAQSGWGDPNLTPDRVLAAFEAHALPVDSSDDDRFRRYELE